MDFKLKTRIRVLLVAVAFASATTFTAIAVPPAQAAVQPAQALDAPECTALLEWWGYDVTLERAAACVVGETNIFQCRDALYADGIRPYWRAQLACEAAAS